MAEALRIHSLVKKYSKETVIGPISITISNGEFVSLLGPSGCGKTTILRCVAGFESVTEGRIFLSGVDISRRPPHLRGVGLVFQSYALFPHLTVFGNVSFSLRLQRIGHEEIQERVRQSLDIVGLAGMENRLPAELSGGQQQRVAIARSLVMRPGILLLDEPLSNLDQKLRLQMRRELKGIQRRTGTTFIYVTHDQSEALAMSDRVVILSCGKIEQCGTPSEIYAHPATKFVADFIGTSNIYNGKVLQRISDCIVEVESNGGPALLATSRTPLAPGAPVWVCIRPEDIAVVQQGAVSPHNGSGTTLSGTVAETAFSGDRNEVRLEISSSNAERPMSMSLFARQRFAVGEPITVAFHVQAAVAVREDTE